MLWCISTSYNPWGKVNSGGTQTKFQYTGQEKDSETGLDYYNARYRISPLGIFLPPILTMTVLAALSDSSTGR
ncbi:hypothetical protein HZA75_04510 [Candidatus Roizmanbacteria bacterium]|nr:hypothetical protein [Candidatus Roizmanbacteria bacterium]